MTLVYFGSFSHILGYPELTRLGQKIELPDELAVELVSSSKPLTVVPESVFDSIGFTEEELKSYPTPASAYKAPEPFRVKRDQLYAKFEAWRKSPTKKSTSNKPVPVPPVAELPTTK